MQFPLLDVFNVSRWRTIFLDKENIKAESWKFCLLSSCNFTPSASALGLSFPCSQSKRNSFKGTILLSLEPPPARFSLFAALYPQVPARLLSCITSPLFNFSCAFSQNVVHERVAFQPCWVLLMLYSTNTSWTESFHSIFFFSMKQLTVVFLSLPCLNSQNHFGGIFEHIVTDPFSWWWISKLLFMFCSGIHTYKWTFWIVWYAKGQSLSRQKAKVSSQELWLFILPLTLNKQLPWFLILATSLVLSSFKNFGNLIV